MVQIQEASRADLMVRLIAAAARDHGPAVFVLGPSAEERLIADVIVRNRIPAALVAVGAEGDVLRAALTRRYGLGADRIVAAESLDRAYFGKQARIGASRGGSIPPYAYDPVRGMLEFNPLAGWSEAEVRAYLEAAGVEHFLPPPRARAPRAEAYAVAA